jgi:hypothetical protein
MTTGAVIFAFNNEKTDYVKMAAWSAKRIRRWLDIPTTVITDSLDPELSNQFDRVIHAAPETGGSRYFEDYAGSVSWHNAGRTSAYNLSPYDQTLVLDSDYVVCSNQLQAIINAPQDFLAHRTALDATRPDEPFLDTFGRNRFPMWWATVMMFRKSITAQYIFDSMTMIKANYQHYRDLYGITERNYRNDYALSIALGLVSGHTLQVDSIPWPMISVLPSAELEKNSAGNNEIWTIKYPGADGKPKTIGIAGQDFHAMGKRHLEAAIETH